jgi:FlaA1/EpsC-like NDP-sugar epimerase
VLLDHGENTIFDTLNRVHEAHPDDAVANNVQGTHSLVDAAIATGVGRLVLIWTDKAVAPSSVMGATKRVAELIVREAARAW